MRRALLATLAVLAIIAGFARADYVILRAPLGGDDLPAVVIVEYDNGGKQDVPALNMKVPWIKHRWGTSFVDVTAVNKQVKFATIAKRYRDQYDALRRNPNRRPRDYLELLAWAVGNGLLDKTLEEKGLMAEFLALDVAVDPLSGEAQKACRAVADKLAEQQKTSLPLDEQAAVWKDALNCRTVSSVDYPHYTLLYDAPTAKPEREVFARLDRLELNYRQFFYFFALRGQVLPMPEKRLIAFLVSEPKDFRRWQQASARAGSDGVYLERDHLLVLSSQRTDPLFDAMRKLTDQRLKAGWDFRKLLTGRGGMPPGWPAVANAAAMQELIDNSTMALVYQSLIEESELAAVSHEGTRQLLTATGLLPRNVIAPEWARFGLPSVFETPKYDPLIQTGPFWPTFGEPNPVYLTNYKLWEQSRSPWLEKPEAALRGVLTDRYVYQAASTKYGDERVRANTMAWALSHYLVHRHPDGLLRYGKELDAQPRDLEMDEQTKLLCFARAFGLVSADAIDTKKFNDFARDWQDFMSTRTLPAPK